MSEKTREICTVVSQESIGAGIYSMWIQTDRIAADAKPGQFVSLYTNDKSKILPRPISLCEIDKENGRLHLVYRVTGQGTGTDEFSQMKAGDTIPVLGPLGNGFPVEKAEGKKVFLMGGGIGVPPILELAKQMDLPYEEDDFEAYTVHAKFQGTMMSSSGFYSGTKDTIDLYLPKEPETILVTNKEAQMTATTIYSEEGLLGNDPYEVFLGGNYGLLNIQTSSQSGRKLLLLKDSYANAMIGFLTPYFSEIDIIDPRYYSSDLDMQIAVNQYTDLLILYNLQSFAKDSSLELVLGEEAAE